MTETNPNGANGTQSDPREQNAWDLYVESITNNRENAYKSAIDAGYSEASAKNITTRDWFIERLGKLKRKDMLSDAEKVLQKTLRYNTEDDEGKIKVDLLRTQLDAAKHITSTLGKDIGYSSRTELAGKDGGAIVLESSDEVKELAKRLDVIDSTRTKSFTSDGVNSDVMGKKVSD